MSIPDEDAAPAANGEGRAAPGRPFLPPLRAAQAPQAPGACRPSPQQGHKTRARRPFLRYEEPRRAERRPAP